LVTGGDRQQRAQGPQRRGARVAGALVLADRRAPADTQGAGHVRMQSRSDTRGGGRHRARRWCPSWGDAQVQRDLSRRHEHQVPIARGLLGARDGDGDPRVTPNVAPLLRALEGVDDHPLAICVDPHSVICEEPSGMRVVTSWGWARSITPPGLRRAHLRISSSIGTVISDHSLPRVGRSERPTQRPLVQPVGGPHRGSSPVGLRTARAEASARHL
jgi:hypothetical protein